MNALEHFKMSNEYYEKKERLQKWIVKGIKIFLKKKAPICSQTIE